MTISDMRLYLMAKYPKSLRWHERVEKMPTRQVVAVYHSMSRRNIPIPEPEGYHQIDMFEYEASLKENNTEVAI